MKKRLITCIAAAALFCAGTAGCAQSEKTPGEEGGTASPAPISSDSVIRLEGSSITADSARVTVAGTAATVTAAGTYEITGRLENGQIIVDCEGQVTLVLNNADISCETSAPIYVKKAKHVAVTLAEHSDNKLTDGADFIVDDALEPDAVLFSKADMTVGGSGSLTIRANYKDGITSKDTLSIENGNISITAASHGIKGKDYLSISGGDITIDAGVDGLKSTNDKEAALGYVAVSGGTINITAQDEGISAITDVKVTGGTILIDTANNGIKTNGAIDITAGTVTISTEDKGLLCAEQKIGSDAAVSVNGAPVSGN